MAYVIVIPAYKPTLTTEERYSLLQLRRLNITSVTLACPVDLDASEYQLLFPQIGIERFDPIHFKSLMDYNRFVSTTLFYERFSKDYEWMLMHQLDAFLLNNRIEHFCNLGFDYYGAPWKNGTESPFFLFNRQVLKNCGPRFYVGNGGFSLRNIPKIIDLLIQKRNHITHQIYLEDQFFGYWGTHHPDFKACPPEIACTFAFETNPRYWLAKASGEYPMGIHAPLKWDPNFYTPLLQPHYDQIDLIYR